MALEQSINLDAKTKGGIVGMSTNEDAVNRWFLTIHERAALTHALKEMCGPENCDRIGTHKEAEATRVSRDERDVQSYLLSDPFQIPEEISEEEIPLTLSNLATGVVLPGADGSILLNAEELGRKSMETFLSPRIQRNEINFWDPIRWLKIKTFSSVAKKVAVSKQKDKTVTVNADRELFGRLLVAARNRDIDLKEIYRLS